MKIKYLSVQIKQFLFGTAFFLLAITGISISNSFDQTYMTRIAKHSRMEAKTLASGKLERQNDLESESEKKNLALSNL